MKHRKYPISYAYQRQIEKPPLRNHTISPALMKCYPNDRLTMSWRYYNRRPIGMWNRYGPPDEWLIETLKHVNRYLRENRG